MSVKCVIASASFPAVPGRRIGPTTKPSMVDRDAPPVNPQTGSSTTNVAPSPGSDVTSRRPPIRWASSREM